MRRETLDAILAAKTARRSLVLAARLDGTGERLIDPSTNANDEVAAAAIQAAREDRSGRVTLNGVEWILNVFNPPLELIVVGAVHIAQALARMAALAGWHVTVIDPRAAFATEDRFPGVDLVNAWPDEAMAALRLHARTAIVTLTHDPKVDDPALEAALGSPAFYVGALGSRKTHAARLARLEAKGFDAPARARIHGPVGLDIEAVTPPEIAVSIMAQIVARLRGAAA